jgi:hypothetical protein
VLYFAFSLSVVYMLAYRDKKVVGVFVRFRAPSLDGSLPQSIYHSCGV